MDQELAVLALCKAAMGVLLSAAPRGAKPGGVWRAIGGPGGGVGSAVGVGVGCCAASARFSARFKVVDRAMLSGEVNLAACCDAHVGLRIESDPSFLALLLWHQS